MVLQYSLQAYIGVLDNASKSAIACQVLTNHSLPSHTVNVTGGVLLSTTGTLLDSRFPFAFHISCQTPVVFVEVAQNCIW
jgi:hypothetical protein